MPFRPGDSAEGRYRIYRGRANLIRLFLFLKFFILLTETLDASGGIDQFLFPRKKRMALGANFDTDVLFSGTDLDLTAAGALNARFKRFRMNVVLHYVSTPLM